jgi:GAF domain-containing protein
MASLSPAPSAPPETPDETIRRLTAELTEAHDQQAASSEILRVINSSPGALAPVFDTILEKAHTLCDTEHGALMTYDGEYYRAAALHGMPEAFANLLRQPFRPAGSGAQERLLQGERLIHIPDAAAVEPVTPIQRASIAAGVRTLLMVPLRRDDALLGYITAHRRKVRPFTDKQIALLENFAAQAVIAMENARLITETREALEQQTATAEVLQVINSSPGDLAPVFDAMLEKAIHLCEAAFGDLGIFDGEQYRWVAAHGIPDFAEYSFPLRPNGNAPMEQLTRGERLVHLADVRQSDAYCELPAFKSTMDGRAVRSLPVVPLRKDGALLGAIRAYRREVRPFSDRQIALLQNFAAQAVIAMENARLITETREALEQQTATAEVLQVINSSPGDLAPVFDAILEKAHSLCGADHGSLFLQDGEIFRAIASRGMPEAMTGLLREGIRANDSPLAQPLMAGEPFVHVHDSALDEHPNWIKRALDVDSNHRTLLSIPLRKSDALLGIIVAGRFEIRPFTDKQIALLQNFAAQAVIAMDNARLITETREALEQQTATAEVLGVINSSPGDLAPVFDAILDKAHSLCAVARGSLELFDGENFRAVATRGLGERSAGELRRGYPASRNPATQPLIEGQPFTHIIDMSHHEFPFARRRAGTLLCVPLRRDDKLLGMIASHRFEVQPFHDKQIALLQNFAAQAVIAMENARLITETREALEQQTATAEVLQVINASPGDLAPVFDAMLERATRLCEAPFGTLRTWDGERFHFGAVHGEPWFADWVRRRHPFQPDPDNSPLGRILQGERVVHITNAPSNESYRTSSGFREMVEASGMRSSIMVALRKDDALVGTITVYRREMRPFSDKQIALLQNFAAQAVIAMENARLITETREALEQQTATSEVLQVINSSPGDLAPVFDAMLERATRLCKAEYGLLATYDGDSFGGVAAVGFPGEVAEGLSRLRHPPPNTVLGRLERTKETVQMADISAEPSYAEVFAVNPMLRGVRTSLSVPMLKEGELVGAFSMFREEVRPFTDKQTALLQNFAAQAVIAMENARLLTETREALEQQTERPPRYCRSSTPRPATPHQSSTLY